MRPARVAHASGPSTIPVYRRVRVGDQVRVGSDEAAPVDRTVDVVRIDDADNKRVATIVALGAHPTVLSGANTLVSGDYPAEARRVVEGTTGAPCLFLQGAAGDVGPRRTFTDDTADVESLGRELGFQALSLAEAADNEIDEASVEPTAEGTWLAPATPSRPAFRPSSAAVTSIDVPLAVRADLGDPTELEQQARAAEEDLASARERNAPEAEIRGLTIAAKRAAMAFDRRRAVGAQRECPVEVHVIRLGEIALASWPVEPFWRSADQVEAASPLEATVLSGYSNDYLQYLPRREDFEMGGYETEMSPFLPGEAERLESATIEACREIAPPDLVPQVTVAPRVFVDDLDHPEGVAVAEDGHVWTGGEAGQVYRISPDGDVVETVARLDAQVLGIALDRHGNAVCCTRGGRVVLVSPAGEVSLVFESVDGRALRLPNFPAFDDRGRLFVSGSGDYGQSNGEIYCFEAGEAHLFHPGPLPYPNGLAVSPDGRHLYVAQTATDDVVRFRLDGVGVPETEPVCSPGSLPTMPDGLAFDCVGDLYVTCYGSDSIWRVSGEGRPVRVVHDTRAIAANRVTNCAFARPPSTEMYLANLGGRVLSTADVGRQGLPLRSGDLERSAR